MFFLRLLVVLSLGLCLHPLQAASESVSIQLKGRHGFRFAGYYAALAQGYYRKAGLDVTLLEGDRSGEAVEQVLAGKAAYGVSDSVLLLQHLRGRPVLLLQQFFQHSSRVFLARRDSGIVSPYEMVGKRVAFAGERQGDVSLQALLLDSVGDLATIRKELSGQVYFQHFIEGKVEVVAADSIVHPYWFKQRGIEVNVIEPRNYGVDFYGDNFFTTRKELERHPERVAKMSRATLEGWRYASAHPEAMIRLIRAKYASHLSEKQLQYEARVTRKLMIPELVEPGTVDARRYRQIAEHYQRLGLADFRHVDPGLFYSLAEPKSPSSVQLTEAEQSWLRRHPQVVVGGSRDWQPFNFVDEQGRYSGIANDYLQLIAEKTGLKLKVKIDQWSRNLEQIREQKIDLLGAVYYTDERAKYLHFSKPYFEMLDYFFVRDDLDLETLQDLNGKRVAIPKSYAHKELINRHFPAIKVVTVDSFSAAIEAVVENRADMLYDTYASLTYTLKKEGINTIIPFRSTRKLGKKGIHIVTRKNAPELASIVQKGLDAISEEEKRAIHERWLSQLPGEDKTALNLSPEERQWIEDHPRIIYGAERDWTPYDYLNRQGKHEGVARDFLDLIERDTGLEFEALVDDWPGLLERARQGRIDLLPVIYFSEARDEFLTFTRSYQSMLDYIFVRDDVEANTLEDLSGRTVAIPKGFLHMETIRKQFPEWRILPVGTLMEAVESVIEKKADILVESHSVISHLLKKHNITTIRPFKILPPGDVRRLYMAVPHDRQILANIINKALAAIAEPERQRIQGKWFGIQSIEMLRPISLTMQEREWLNRQPRLRFGGNPDWLPYEGFDADGRYIGIVADYLRLIEQLLPLEFDIAPTVDWNETRNKVRAREIDVLSESLDSPLHGEMLFTRPYMSSPVVIVMSESEDYVDGIEQIRQRKLAVIKGYGDAAKIRRDYPDIEFAEMETIEEGMTAVSTGKVDALLCTLAQASYRIAELGINNVRIVGKTEYSTEWAFALRRELQPLMPLFNRALAAIGHDHKQRILQNWGKTKFAAKTDYTLLLQIASMLLLVLLIFGYWNRRLADEVSRRKQSQQALAALNRRFRLAADAVALGVWEFNCDVGLWDEAVFIFDEKMYDIYGLDKNVIVSWKCWLTMIHPEDRESIKRCFEDLSQQGGQQHIEFRISRPDEGIRTVYCGVSVIARKSKECQFVGINWDISQIKQTELEMKQARFQAEQANRAKSEFLANMSHEIRTPMNAIIGFTELLDEQLEEPRLKTFVKTIRTAGNNLLALINDILDLSKIEAGKLEIVKTVCNPHELFCELGDVFMMKMREKNLDFLLDIDPVIPSGLLLDSVRLRQVLFNLIGNAVKFTEQGHIRVKARTDNEDNIRSKLDLLIDVEDSGIGISEDQQQRIFRDFEQSNGQDVRKYGGTGLGLSISKRLVDMMGGEISLKSRVGEGAVFTIKLTDVAISSLSNETESQDTVMNSKWRFHPAHILVVDDVADNRGLLAAALAGTELSVVEAENGLQAVELANCQSFDLLLMDIRMPVMDGYQAAEKIKALCEVPIIALTASVMTDEFERVRSEHFDGYLSKPVLKADLFKELGKFLRYDELQAERDMERTVSLSREELERLPELVARLKPLLAQCQDLSKYNNMSAIRDFSAKLAALNEHSQLAVFVDYTGELQKQVECFDIGAIKQSLNRFPGLVQELEQLLNAQKP